MVNPQSAREGRNPEIECRALHAIQEQNATTYKTQKPVAFDPYCADHYTKAQRSQRTPYSIFVIFLGDAIIGRLGIAQGYSKTEADLAILREAAPRFGVSPGEVYDPGNNEVQVGALLKPKDYQTNFYLELKFLALRVAEIFHKSGFQKHINEEEQPYHTRPSAPIDRATFTAIDASRLSDEVPEGERLLLRTKYEAAQRGCETGMWKRLGILLPATDEQGDPLDPRNYSDSIRVVYGRDIQGG